MAAAIKDGLTSIINVKPAAQISIRTEGNSKESDSREHIDWEYDKIGSFEARNIKISIYL